MANQYTLSLSASISAAGLATLQTQLDGFAKNYTMQINAAIQQVQQATTQATNTAASGGDVTPAAPQINASASALADYNKQTTQYNAAMTEATARTTEYGSKLTELTVVTEALNEKTKQLEVTSNTVSTNPLAQLQAQQKLGEQMAADTESQIRLDQEATGAEQARAIGIQQMNDALTRMNTSGDTYVKTTEKMNADGQVTNATFVAQGENLGEATKTTLNLNDATGKFSETTVDTAKDVTAIGEATQGWIGDIVNAIEKMVLWAIAAEALFGTIRKIGDGIQYVKDLNAVMTQTQMITGASIQSTNDLAKSYNKLAEEVGSTTIDIANANEVFLREGKSVNDSLALTKTSAEMAAIGVMDVSTASSNLVAILNSFNLSANNSTKVLDDLTTLSQHYGVTVEGLSGGLQTVGAAANSVGVSYQQLASFISVLSNTTQQSGDTIAENLKMIFARSDAVKAGADVDSFGESVSNVETVLNKNNIALRDATGAFLPLGNVIDAIAEKWSSLSNSQQNQIATSMAGAKSYQNFEVLMNNYNQVLSAQTDLTNDAGTSQKAFATYLDSAAVAANKATTAWQAVWSATIHSGAIIFFDNLSAAIANMIAKMGGLFGSTGGPFGILVETIAELERALGNNAIADQLDTLFDKISHNTSATDASAKATDAQNAAYEAQLPILKSVQENQPTFDLATLDTYTKDVTALTSEYDDLNSALQKQKDGSLSTDDIIKLISAHADLAQYLKYEGDNVTLDTDAIKKYEAEQLGAQIITLLVAEAKAKDAGATDEQVAAIESELKALGMLVGELDNLGNVAMTESEAASAQATLTSQIVSMIGQQKDAEKQALQDELDAYTESVNAQKDALDAQKNAIQEATDAYTKMADAEKSAIKAEEDAYTKIIDAIKTKLQLMHDEQNYKDELAQKEQAVSETQMQLEALSLDNSQEAAAQRLKLQDTLTTQTADLNKTQSDKQYSDQQTALDNELAAYKAEKDGEIAAIQSAEDAYKSASDARIKLIENEQSALDNNLKVYTTNIQNQEKAITDYLSKSGQVAQDAMAIMYDPETLAKLQAWNLAYGTGVENTVTKAWMDAAAAKAYYDSIDYASVLGLSASATSDINNQLNAQNPTNDPLGTNTTYAVGGLVTGGVEGQDSVSSKLMPGEYVLKKSAVNSIGIGNLNKWNSGVSMGGTPSITGGGAGNTHFEMPIYVSGSLDKTVLPDLEKMVTKTFQKLNSAMLQRGYKRTVNSFSS